MTLTRRILLSLMGGGAMLCTLSLVELALIGPRDCLLLSWVIGTTLVLVCGLWAALLPHPRQHVWRRPTMNEPMEEDGVCVLCGKYANSEGDQPCEEVKT